MDGRKLIGRKRASWPCENCGVRRVWLVGEGVSVRGPYREYACQVCGYTFDRACKRASAQQRGMMKALGSINRVARDVLQGSER